MEFAAESSKPPILFVYVDYSMCDGGGTSNTTNKEAMHNSESFSEAQMRQSYHPEPTYGLSDYYPEFVQETQPHHQQQDQQQQGQEEEEEEDRRKFQGCDDNEAHVFTLGLSDLELSYPDNDEYEEGMETTISSIRSGVLDYFGMPPPFPTPELSITSNEVVPYDRSSRVSCGQIFDTKEEMIL